MCRSLPLESRLFLGLLIIHEANQLTSVAIPNANISARSALERAIQVANANEVFLSLFVKGMFLTASLRIKIIINKVKCLKQSRRESFICGIYYREI